MVSFLQSWMVKFETRLFIKFAKALRNEKFEIPIERVWFQIGIGMKVILKEERILIIELNFNSQILNYAS